MAAPQPEPMRLAEPGSGQGHRYAAWDDRDSRTLSRGHVRTPARQRRLYTTTRPTRTAPRSRAHRAVTALAPHSVHTTSHTRRDHTTRPRVHIYVQRQCIFFALHRQHVVLSGLCMRSGTRPGDFVGVRLFRSTSYGWRAMQSSRPVARRLLLDRSQQVARSDAQRAECVAGGTCLPVDGSSARSHPPINR